MEANRSELRELVTSHSSEFRAEAALLRLEMASEFAAVRAEMASEFAAVRAESKALRAEMVNEFAAVRAEMASESAALRDLIDRRLVEHKADLMAAMLTQTRWMVGAWIASTTALLVAILARG